MHRSNTRAVDVIGEAERCSQNKVSQMSLCDARKRISFISRRNPTSNEHVAERADCAQPNETTYSSERARGRSILSSSRPDIEVIFVYKLASVVLARIECVNMSNSFAYSMRPRPSSCKYANIRRSQKDEITFVNTGDRS